jgi:hypothetical protein
MACIVATLNSVGQWGNEWIDYNKTYWKFPVTADGFYILSATNLMQSGIDWANQDPHQIQVWGKGQNQNIDFVGDDDAILESNEFFFGYFTGNHGEMENEAYASSTWRPDPEYSLFNDTLWYYLTTGNNSVNITTTLQLPGELNVPIHQTVTSVVKHALHSHYYVGRSDNNGISLSTYDEAEGWYDPAFGTNTYIVNGLLPHRQINSTVTLSWRVGGVNSALGIPNHHLQVGLGADFDIIRDTTFTGHKMLIQSEAINPSDGQEEFTIGFRAVNDLGVNSDLMAVGAIVANYQRVPTFLNTQVHVFHVDAIEDNSWTKVNLQLNGYTNPQCYVFQNGLKSRLPLLNNNLQWELYIPWQGESTQKIILTESTVGFEVEPIMPLQFVDYSVGFAAENLVLIASPSLWNEANNYAQYKATSEQPVLLADINQLYHQYGGGVEKNPIAIRRFMKHQIDEGMIPAHLFLIGKGIHDAPLGGETGARNDTSKYARNLIPTWGYPGSDVLFTAGLNGTLYEPAVPTGRLAAESGDEVLDYLNKVIEFESQPPALWRKNVLHFGGGSIAYEQDLFRNYLDTYKQTAEGLQWGGKVHSFYKNTAEPVQLNVSDSIQLLINEGVSVMTFFGHASSTGFDQNIDAPESYSNQGKYPLLIGNSCYTGNIHLGASQSASERFVLAPNRGVIGFLAKGDLGIPTYLDLYTSNFYRHLFDVSYGSSIGQCMQRAIVNFESLGDFYEQNVAQNFMLHGDPSLVLFPFQRPDLALQSNAISSHQAIIPASSDPTTIEVVVQNLGKGSTDEIELVLVQTMPNGDDSTYLHLINGLLRTDTIAFHMTNFDLPGTYSISAFVDLPGNEIEELEDFSNNSLTDYLIQVTDGDLRPIYPYEFAVIDESPAVVRASTAFPLEPTRQYIVQADTSSLYNSSLLAETTVTSNGGVISWELPITMSDSMVVFWRCSPLGTELRWRSSSFQYLPQRRGWGMQHTDQFKSLQLQGLTWSNDPGLWQFETSSALLKCDVYGGADTYFENLATRYQLDLDVQEYGGYGYSEPALMVAVLDSASLEPWLSNYNNLAMDHVFGNTLASANARNRQEKYFIFQQNDLNQLEGLANMLSSSVASGHHLLLYTWQYALPQLWPASLTDALQEIGWAELTSLPDSIPFIAYLKAGNSETSQLVIGSNSESFIQLSQTLTGLQGHAFIRSPVIGPALEWDQCQWAYEADAIGSADELITYIRSAQPGSNQTLAGNQNLWTMSDLDLSTIDAEEHTQIKWDIQMEDSAEASATALRRLHVLFSEAPEFAIDAASGFSVSADTVDQGAYWQCIIPIRNAGWQVGDSLLLWYTLVDDKGIEHPLSKFRIGSLAANGLYLDTMIVATAAWPGANRLRLRINPTDSLTGRLDQPEQYTFNNSLEQRFYVIGDRVPPVLEVTADGRHLIDGELISATPEILITLRDNHPFLVMNAVSDTAYFRVYLTYPNGTVEWIRFNDPRIEVQVAGASDEPFRVFFRPQLVSDGIYTLRVQATDRNGNLSGQSEYRIHFKVLNESSITELINYPNPFSTSTRFVFTITGSELPTDMKIQIMTIGGEVVREIFQEELGPLYIGRNITEYAWDGRDDFGDLLANGLYLYRTIVRHGDQDMKRMQSGADAHIKHGFGKMYLMR